MKRSFVALIAGILSACASSGGAQFSALDCPTSVSGDSVYRMGPGDVLQIFVWRNEELSTEVTVRPDGRISTPLVDDMLAAGRSPSELARAIEDVLVEFIRSPTVNVMIVNEGNANQVQVIGSVVEPLGLSHREGLTVLDAIVASGGLSEFAAGNRAKIIREFDGGQAECRLRLDDLVRKARMGENVALYPGDVIVVPETRL
ncbi:MAG: polysaccharide biosynthesis/export family protein [Gammaproteobacteria bacterium]|nr:polysaccharide biosynthesis/export family protein [Gammaproteobacteria bacterium]